MLSQRRSKKRRHTSASTKALSQQKQDENLIVSSKTINDNIARSLGDEDFSLGDEALQQVTMAETVATQQTQDEEMAEVQDEEIAVIVVEQASVKNGKKGKLKKKKKKKHDVMAVTTRATKARADKHLHGIRKPHRYKPGTVALRQIKKLQHINNTTGTKNCIPLAPFKRLCKQILVECGINRMSKEALAALQTGAEDYIVSLLECTNLVTVASRKVTITAHNMRVVRQIRGEMEHLNYDGRGVGHINTIFRKAESFTQETKK